MVVFWYVMQFAMAENPADFIAQIEADVDAGKIELTFSSRDFSQSMIQRRSLGLSDPWYTIDFLAQNIEGTTWTDPDAQVGDIWEYRVTRTGTQSATGYITVALEAELNEQRGKVALIVEQAVESGLHAELEQLKWDLVGDGWTVVEHSVDAGDRPEDVRALIQAEADVEAVLLIGHVPVPYSGNMYPDGHTDHQGAWPADTYYADVDGEWTDISVNETSASRPENHNVPGDGRFDQSTIPSSLELQVGRIDMHNLTSFEEDELTLLQRYFHKNHAWRHAQVEVEEAVVIDDNFGVYAPGSFTGWLLSPVVGRDGLHEGDFLETLTTSPYLFGYGSGAGSYRGASGVASSSDFASQEILGVFLMIFGSYHGDWDSEDNLLRAAIAGEGNSLTCVWGGRPVHQHHALGTGQTIGFAVRSSQNSFENIATMDFNARGVHTALLGDPTLHAFPVKPAQELEADSLDANGGIKLRWKASGDSDILGYHVYRSEQAMGPYTRITTELVDGLEFSEELTEEGTFWWMVRAVKRQVTYSGAFQTASQGVFVSLDVECAETDCQAANGGNSASGSDAEKPSSCSHLTTNSHRSMILGMLLAAIGYRRRMSPVQP